MKRQEVNSTMTQPGKNLVAILPAEPGENTIKDNTRIALKEIGERLRQLRIKAGYESYESFATAFELSRMQYWRIEKGKTNLTMKSLMRLLEIHKVTLSEFLCYDLKQKNKETADKGSQVD